MGRSAKERSGRSNRSPDQGREFAEGLRRLLGNESDLLRSALEGDPPTSLRVNPTKWAGPEAAPIPWCTQGKYLDERPAFTFDPLLHAGAYYVQEASSMLVEQALKATGLLDRELLALDLCAAPGGKTTHLISLLSPGSLIVANEIERKRQYILQENLWKWGAANTVVTGSAPQDLDRLPEFFDLILVDAPCSGEGMFRKDPFAREQWSPALVQQCASTQRGIMDHAWNALRPGGALIYSTCTWEEAENETQLARLVAAGAESIRIPTEPQWGVVSVERNGVHALRCYPHRLKGEGFFIGVLKKPGELQPRTRNEGSTRPGTSDDFLNWLDAGRSWSFSELEQVTYAVECRWSAIVSKLSGSMRMRSPGIPVAEQKGADKRPHAALALSMALRQEAFPLLDLEHDQALEYLRGSAIPASAAAGTTLVRHAGIGLGWVQGAGNRWNNRWPAPWRIRSHRPSTALVSWARSA